MCKLLLYDQVTNPPKLPRYRPKCPAKNDFFPKSLSTFKNITASYLLTSYIISSGKMLKMSNPVLFTMRKVNLNFLLSKKFEGSFSFSVFNVKTKYICIDPISGFKL